MPDDMSTKPTIETILEKMVASEERLLQRFDQLEKRTDERFAQFEKQTDERFTQFEKRTDERFTQFEKRTDERFDKLENEIDLLSMVASSTKYQMSELRLEFRELRAQVKDVLPIPQQK